MQILSLPQHHSLTKLLLCNMPKILFHELNKVLTCSFSGGLSAALGDIMVLVLASMSLLPMAANEEGAPLAMLLLCWLLGGS
jgi:hypothetical protein